MANRVGCTGRCRSRPGHGFSVTESRIRGDRGSIAAMANTGFGGRGGAHARPLRASAREQRRSAVVLADSRGVRRWRLLAAPRSACEVPAASTYGAHRLSNHAGGPGCRPDPAPLGSCRPMAEAARRSAASVLRAGRRANSSAPSIPGVAGVAWCTDAWLAPVPARQWRAPLAPRHAIRDTAAPGVGVGHGGNSAAQTGWFDCAQAARQGPCRQILMLRADPFLISPSAQRPTAGRNSSPMPAQGPSLPYTFGQAGGAPDGVTHRGARAVRPPCPPQPGPHRPHPSLRQWRDLRGP